MPAIQHHPWSLRKQTIPELTLILTAFVRSSGVYSCVDWWLAAFEQTGPKKRQRHDQDFSALNLNTCLHPFGTEVCFADKKLQASRAHQLSPGSQTSGPLEMEFSVETRTARHPKLQLDIAHVSKSSAAYS